MEKFGFLLVQTVEFLSKAFRLLYDLSCVQGVILFSFRLGLDGMLHCFDLIGHLGLKLLELLTEGVELCL